MNNIRLIPEIRYTNFRKEFRNCCDNCFQQWFYINKRWSGKIINVGIKHHQISFDFRKNWILDMVNGVK